MAFKIEANPEIPAKLTLVGQGREQELNVVYKFKTASEREKLVKKLDSEKTGFPEIVKEILISWDADKPLSLANLKNLEDNQPGSCLAIWAGYLRAILVERKGN